MKPARRTHLEELVDVAGLVQVVVRDSLLRLRQARADHLAHRRHRLVLVRRSWARSSCSSCSRSEAGEGGEHVSSEHATLGTGALEGVEVQRRLAVLQDRLRQRADEHAVSGLGGSGSSGSRRSRRGRRLSRSRRGSSSRSRSCRGRSSSRSSRCRRGGRSGGRGGVTIDGLLRGAGEGGNVLLVLNHNGDGLADVDVLGTLGHQNLRHIALRVNDKQRHHFLLGGEIERALIGGDLDVRAARRSQT